MNEESFDVIVLGAGPAGLQAAIHAARRKVSVLVLGKLPKSSVHNVHLENFCCIDGDSGADLLLQARAKAEESGADFLEEDVTGIQADNDRFIVKAESQKSFRAKALVLAMGISRKRLGLKGEKRLLGRGISYCVDCDAGFYRGESVAVIGCESAAISGTLTMLFYAAEVHLICEKLDTVDYLMEKLKESSISVHEGRKVVEIIGDNAVQGLKLDDGMQIDVKGVFIELGAKGATTLAANLGVALDTETMNYIQTNKKQETNVPGVYAAGDICGPPWQVPKAIGEGCVAGLEAAAYAKKL
ncbi:MAG: FAD-dependent oxidoreductase [Desulfohalobiaceae bacterium]|nr:FAD-dependent oxidoreductase [Desulfohalobiaceae bacterium]